MTPFADGREAVISTVLFEHLAVRARRAAVAVDRCLESMPFDWTHRSSSPAVFDAEIILTISADRSDVSRPGRHAPVGAIFCRSAAEAAIVRDAHLQASLQPDRLRALVASVFGVPERRAPFCAEGPGREKLAPDATISFSHCACDACGGGGQVGCGGCGGCGQVRCTSCTGGTRRCYGCSGSGTVRRSTGTDGKGSFVVVNDRCSICSGSGRCRCTMCSGTTQLSCNPCGGSGRVRCRPCAGFGSFTDTCSLAVGAAFSSRAGHDVPALCAAAWSEWRMRGFPPGDAGGPTCAVEVSHPVGTGDGGMRCAVHVSGSVPCERVTGSFEDLEFAAVALSLDRHAVRFEPFLDGLLGRTGEQAFGDASSPGAVLAKVAASSCLKDAFDRVSKTPVGARSVAGELSLLYDGAFAIDGLAALCTRFDEIRRAFCRSVWRSCWRSFAMRVAPLPTALLLSSAVGLIPHRPIVADAAAQTLILLAVAMVPALLATRRMRRELDEAMGETAALPPGMSLLGFPLGALGTAGAFFVVNLCCYNQTGAQYPQTIETAVASQISDPGLRGPVTRSLRKDGFVPLRF